MPKQIPDDAVNSWPSLRRPPSRAPRAMERLATASLKAELEDSRLGDLSEQYVRTYEYAKQCLGDTPLAMTLARLAADVRYVFSAANVVLFARTIDPRPRVADPDAKETITVDLKERAMIMLSSAAKKMVLPALLLVGSAFLIGGAVNVWTTWRETEALLIGLQREKAGSAAAQIQQYFAVLRDRIGWATDNRATVSLEQGRSEYIRLLRQVPAITEIVQLNGEGKEVLKVSRLVRDAVDGGADFSGDTRVIEALKHKTHVSPAYFNDRGDPYVSLAMAHAGPNPGVTLTEVSIKRVWDIVDSIKVGESGYAYLVDQKGRLIASRDKAAVSGQSDLSALPQVAAALAQAPSETADQGKTFDTSPSGGPALSVHAAVPTLGWKVFVELPMAEARAPLWSALVRAVSLLGLGLLAIFLASYAAARRDMSAQPARI